MLGVWCRGCNNCGHQKNIRINKYFIVELSPDRRDSLKRPFSGFKTLKNIINEARKSFKCRNFSTLIDSLIDEIFGKFILSGIHFL